MNFQDELPCGGYANEDSAIQKEIKIISESKECPTNKQGQRICQKCECTQKITIEEKKSLCKKCQTQRAVLLHKGSPICQDCLFKNMEYKSRLLIQNNLKVKKDSNLLICFSGGINSICLTVIVLNIMKKYQKNKLFDKLGILHIQQQSNLPEGYLQKFKQITGLDIAVIKIQQVLDKGKRSLEQVKNILSLFNKTGNTVDLVTIFRDRLIIDYAQKNGYSFVLKGLNGESLATETFKYFAKGLGGNISGLSWNQAQKGPFYYPLRNHLQKELQYYFYIKKLSGLSIKSEQDDIAQIGSSGLDTHINNFILTLQQMYSHTAPAIVRTAEKIDANLPSKQSCRWCSLPGATDYHLCRRCQRIWQSRRPIVLPALLPVWMRQ